MGDFDRAIAFGERAIATFRPAGASRGATSRRAGDFATEIVGESQ